MNNTYASWSAAKRLLILFVHLFNYSLRQYIISDRTAKLNLYVTFAPFEMCLEFWQARWRFETGKLFRTNLA